MISKFATGFVHNLISYILAFPYWSEKYDNCIFIFDVPVGIWYSPDSAPLPDCILLISVPSSFIKIKSAFSVILPANAPDIFTYIFWFHNSFDTLIYLFAVAFIASTYVFSSPSYASIPNASLGISTFFVASIFKPDSFFTLFAFIVPLVISNGPVYTFHVAPLSIE